MHLPKEYAPTSNVSMISKYKETQISDKFLAGEPGSPDCWWLRVNSISHPLTRQQLVHDLVVTEKEIQ